MSNQKHIYKNCGCIYDGFRVIKCPDHRTDRNYSWIILVLIFILGSIALYGMLFYKPKTAQTPKLLSPIPTSEIILQRR